MANNSLGIALSAKDGNVNYPESLVYLEEDKDSLDQIINESSTATLRKLNKSCSGQKQQISVLQSEHYSHGSLIIYKTIFSCS